MKNTSKETEISLHVPPQMWQQFKQVMLESRTQQEEIIGFFLCERHQVSARKIRYFATTWVVPSLDCYESQSAVGIVLKQEFHLYLLNNYLRHNKLHIVHIHTHPSLEDPHFSSIDDHHESEYARFLSSSFLTKPHLISGVFSSEMQHYQFRIWNRQGSYFQAINFYHSWFEFTENKSNKTTSELIFDRQLIFGSSFQNQLASLTVGLIGCGGIGAIFAEILARLGVKKWLLIDPDYLETVNLNRMPAATAKMVEQQWYKVHYVKRLIKGIYTTGSQVKALSTSVEDVSNSREIAKCDLIVVATDNHFSRQIAQEIALEYLRPLVCLGTHIELTYPPNHLRKNGLGCISQSHNTPRMYCRITIPPLGGGWCLMCGNIINLQQAAMEASAAPIHQIAVQKGYLEGVNDPAVFWLNSICASTAVGIIHGLVGGFVNFDDGLDWIYSFPESHWLKTDVEHLVTPNCYFCSD
ncbi:MAG: ThiF family adenylyltransferase [Snowella sp.]